MIAWDLAAAPSVDGTRRRSMEDLIDRIGLTDPRTVIDLGCGSGRSSRLLAHRYPDAHILAVETDAECLQKAREHGDCGGRIRYIDSPVEEWESFGRADVIFSSGVFQKLPGHERLLPILLRMLSPWGVLAIMMPRNTRGAPYEQFSPAVTGLPWHDEAESLNESVAMGPAVRYSRILTPRVQKLDIWETVYHVAMKSHTMVMDLASGSAPSGHDTLVSAPDNRDFLDEYIDQVRGAYTSDKNGMIVYPLRHIFIVARNPVTQHSD